MELLEYHKDAGMLEFKVGDRTVPSRYLLGEMLSRWAMLTRPETEDCLDDYEKLVQLLQNRCGFVRTRAEKELNVFLREFREKMLRAA